MICPVFSNLVLAIPNHQRLARTGTNNFPMPLRPEFKAISGIVKAYGENLKNLKPSVGEVPHELSCFFFECKLTQICDRALPCDTGPPNSSSGHPVRQRFEGHSKTPLFQKRGSRVSCAADLGLGGME